jgi:hypothetical protein
MDLKTKVIRISVTVGIALLLAASGYLVYFIISDTLQPPPENAVAKNLFIEKDSIDIANLKNTTNINDNWFSFNSIWWDMYENTENNFIDQREFDVLWKRLNFEYAEHFIKLANEYFAKPEWNSNNFVQERISEIKRRGFVERNTPIWNKLSGFESSISWYNQMQNLIRWANAVIDTSFRSYFPAQDMATIKSRKAELEKMSCRKNDGKASELNTAYREMQGTAFDYLQEKIKQYNTDFNKENEDTSNKRHDANYKRYYEVENYVKQWNNIFYNNSDLNKQLQEYKDHLDKYYN